MQSILKQVFPGFFLSLWLQYVGILTHKLSTSSVAILH